MAFAEFAQNHQLHFNYLCGDLAKMFGESDQFH